MSNTQTVLHTLTWAGLTRSSLERRSGRLDEGRHSLAIPRLQDAGHLHLGRSVMASMRVASTVHMRQECRGQTAGMGQS